MSDKYTAEQVEEAIKHLRMLCDYAYEKGFHELGYDPVEVVSQAAQMMREREVQPATDLDGFSEAVEAYKEVGDLLAVMHGDGGHYQAVHGTKKAAIDAKEIYYAMLPAARHEREVGGAVTDDAMATICKLARHADDCLSHNQLPTGDGSWHCSCGYDTYVLDGKPILESFAARRAAVPDGLVKVGGCKYTYSENVGHVYELYWLPAYENKPRSDIELYMLAAAPEVTK